MRLDYDVIIIGSGMVGGCLGLALSQTTLRVGIVEAKPPLEKQTDDAGKRAIALSWGSRCILKQLNLWQEISDYAKPIRHIHVSDKGAFGKTRLSAKKQQLDALGYVVDAVQIEAIVSSNLLASNVDMICPATLVDYAVEDEKVGVTIKLNGKEQVLSCRLLVGADGGLSDVRQLGDFDLKEYPYEQQAITSLIEVESDQHDVAYERFTSEGPIAMLPHIDGLYSLVWTMPSALAEQVTHLPEEEFLQRLQSRFGQWLGELSLVGAYQVFPLRLLRVSKTISDRVVLIGNAAHQLHPVAGQGFNLGLRDAVILADTLMSADEDVGVETVLEAYENQRKTDQALVTGFTDSVIKLFSTNNAVLSLLRNSGLMMLDKVPVLKNQFARQAMGLGARFARLKSG